MNEIQFNSITEKLPKHLHKYILKQPYDTYTAQNQAVWRYVMRSNINYLQSVCYGDFIGGLKSTGISVEKIPVMEGMNRILKDIGWAAVAVDGFIPPNVFMEFQANNVLVISADIRTIKHIEYTPAPDIIHEAAGHAPIIADKEYAKYLIRFGQVGAKAFTSPKDEELFYAIRELSMLKENPNSSIEEIEKSQKIVEDLQNNMGELSEMAKVRNLHWWTVEYGLIGDIDNPKIYGAGLLSSIKESKECLNKSLPKLPYDINAADVNFDITKPQPQLFVTPSFEVLNEVLEQFINSMSFEVGGLIGIQNAINSKKIASLEFASGLKISTVFSEVISSNAEPVFIKTSKNIELALNNKLIDNSLNKIDNNYGFPTSFLIENNKYLNECCKEELDTMGIKLDHRVKLNFSGDISVDGLIKKMSYHNNKLIMISFDECIIQHNDKIIFQSKDRKYDMLIVDKITSAYPALIHNEESDDRAVFNNISPKIKYSDNEKNLFDLYDQIRNMRRDNQLNHQKINQIFQKLIKDFPEEWLLLLEMYELVFKSDSFLENKLLNNLIDLQTNLSYRKLISRGIDLINQNYNENNE